MVELLGGIIIKILYIYILHVNFIYFKIIILIWYIWIGNIFQS